MERNELNKNARGGTELIAERIEKLVDPSLLSKVQIIHTRVRDLDENKKKILVIHDLPGDPEVEHLKEGGWKKFDKIVFVSNWQKELFRLIYQIEFSRCTIIENAIDPINGNASAKPNDEINLIYFSTPHRGLDLLYTTFDALCEEYDNLKLKVFSSFDLYGWEDRDKQFEVLFEKLKDHPKIEYSKSVTNERIREELENSHIFAYPSTWMETSCLCLIEAMSAGCACVHSSLAALPETSKGLTEMYDFTEVRQDHVNIFYDKLADTIDNINNNKDDFTSKQVLASKVIGETHNLQVFKEKWENLLLDVLDTD